MAKQSFEAVLVKGGEGSWTRVNIPFDVGTVFGKKGHVQVKGRIDGCLFEKSKLMPAGNGRYWLPVNERIRKAIHKSDGDPVSVEIEADEGCLVLDMPEDFSAELQKHPAAAAFFEGLAKGYQRWFIESVTSAKKAETRRRRMEKAMEKLSAGKRFHDV
jgi:hypothetical protein